MGLEMGTRENEMECVEMGDAEASTKFSSNP